MFRREGYDTIVVGGGPSGCVLASRLSERADQRVLLLEAGPDSHPGHEHPDVRDPFPISVFNPKCLWRDITESIAATATGEELAWSERPYAKGYGIGGGSNVNGMAADRGQPGDYKEWGAIAGPDWSWERVLPYFNKLERDTDFTQPGEEMHGHVGPIPVRRLPRSRWAPFAAAVSCALEARGFNFIEDYMADFRSGFSAVPTNSMPQGRVSASMAYLSREVRDRANLTISGGAQVDRINISGGRATGVFVQKGDGVELVHGGRVLIACGGIQSPAVLMRSGIGPADHLRQHGIQIAKDVRGVGANLQNHPCVRLLTYLRPEAFQPADNPWFLQSWLRYSSNHPQCGDNDMHLMHFNRTAWHSLGARVGMIAVSVLQAYSKGRVELRSSHPTAAPRVQFNLLSDKRDLERLTDGLKFALELLVDPGVAATRHEVFIPEGGLISGLGRRNTWTALQTSVLARILDNTRARTLLLRKLCIDPQQILRDRVSRESFVRHYASPQSHDCGTCRMGADDDSEAVVDGAGRVHGIDSLRVVDTSIFPAVPRGYPHFIVLMLAEKIAAELMDE